MQCCSTLKTPLNESRRRCLGEGCRHSPDEWVVECAIRCHPLPLFLSALPWACVHLLRGSRLLAQQSLAQTRNPLRGFQHMRCPMGGQANEENNGVTGRWLGLVG